MPNSWPPTYLPQNPQNAIKISTSPLTPPMHQCQCHPLSATQQPQQSTADQPGNRQSAAAGTSPAHPLCHSLIDIRRHATNDQQQPTALTTQSMNHRLLIAEQPQQEDFYSSSEYVRHSAVGSGPAEHNYENGMLPNGQLILTRPFSTKWLLFI